MNPEEILSELSALLGMERRAIERGEMEALITLGGRQAELILRLEDAREPLSSSLESAARIVRRRALSNNILLRNLSGNFGTCHIDHLYPQVSTTVSRRSPSNDS